jgi:heme-degrading monooxygenase HmoA
MGSIIEGMRGGVSVFARNRSETTVALPRRPRVRVAAYTKEAIMGAKLTGVLLAAVIVVLGLGLAAGTRGAEEGGLMAMSSRPGKPVIARAWHGKTSREKADEYEKYLAGAITKFPSIRGNLGYQLMRIDGGPDGDRYTEFQVISYWESLEAIHAYAGEDIRRTRDLPRDREFLVGMEPHVRNYELRVNAIRP